MSFKRVLSTSLYLDDDCLVNLMEVVIWWLSDVCVVYLCVLMGTAFCLVYYQFVQN